MQAEEQDLKLTDTIEVAKHCRTYTPTFMLKGVKRAVCVKCGRCFRIRKSTKLFTITRATAIAVGIIRANDKTGVISKNDAKDQSC